MLSLDLRTLCIPAAGSCGRRSTGPVYWEPAQLTKLGSIFKAWKLESIVGQGIAMNASQTTRKFVFVLLYFIFQVHSPSVFFSHYQECLLCQIFIFPVCSPSFVLFLTLPGMSSLSTFLPSRSSHLHFFFSHCQGCLLCLNFCLPGPFIFISPLQILSLLSNWTQLPVGARGIR